MRNIALTLALALWPFAVTGQDIAAIVAGVTELCNSGGTTESGSSSRLEVDGEASGDIRIRLIGKAGIAGEIEMTEEEWTGIQQVVREDQLADNQGRRDCVQQLTPLFLSGAR